MQIFPFMKREYDKWYQLKCADSLKFFVVTIIYVSSCDQFLSIHLSWLNIIISLQIIVVGKKQKIGLYNMEWGCFQLLMQSEILPILRKLDSHKFYFVYIHFVPTIYLYIFFSTSIMPCVFLLEGVVIAYSSLRRMNRSG